MFILLRISPKYKSPKLRPELRHNRRQLHKVRKLMLLTSVFTLSCLVFERVSVTIKQILFLLSDSRMGWVTGSTVILLTIHLSINTTSGIPVSSNTFTDDQFFEDDTIPEQKLENLKKYLTEILLEPWPEGLPPLIYVEDPLLRRENPDEMHDVPFKRSRYYRRYPWKRQNQKWYDPENRYMCQPSKDDVFRLLVALHEARQGSRSKTVSFCNRKRPASAVFTNIRFLG